MGERTLSCRVFGLFVAFVCATLLAACGGDGGGGGVPAPSIASVSISSPTTSPKEGDTLQLTAEARDQFGAVVPGTTAAWSVSDTNLAAISPAGVLQAFHEGSVVATAAVNGVSGTQTFTISPIRVSVTVGSTKEVVFRWITDRCYDQDTPDKPARFVRAEDGSLALASGNAPRHYLSRGADFNSLRRDCNQPALVSADRITPESYENQEWLWVLYREGNRWHALIHNEYHDPLATTCKPGDTSPGNLCWYNSITYAVSMDGARSFVKPSPPAHVVAPAAEQWIPPSQPVSTFYPEGYRSPTNIMRGADGYYYSLFEAVWNPINEKHGVCIMRTASLSDPSSWQAWDGTGYNLRMTSPYATGQPAPLCTPLEMPTEVSHVVYSSYLDRYMVVRQWQTMIEGRLVCGLYFDLSADLIHWSKPQLLVEVQHTWCNVPPTAAAPLDANPVSYPSLVDHADSTANFERVGRTPYLYYVRYNRGTMSDPLFWLDRDLVRVPLTFARLD